ncbi:MAG: hypothetical protein KDB27_13805 [Planctomycetales bacterium]|nr:hypothetical protein [Planctomycetales bacterium]
MSLGNGNWEENLGNDQFADARPVNENALPWGIHFFDVDYDGERDLLDPLQMFRTLMCC